MRIRLFFIVACLLLLGEAIAQTDDKCDAKRFFSKQKPCDDLDVGKKCIQLEVDNNMVKQAKEFVYQWDFDDGNKKRGLRVEHCYRDYGSYMIMLDLIDEKNNVVIKNEFSKKILLLPPLKAQSIDTVYNDVAVKFLYDSKRFKNYRTDQVFWRVDGKFYCGRQVKHLFNKPGFYLVEVGVSKSLGQDKKVAGCGIRGVLVKTNIR